MTTIDQLIEPLAHSPLLPQVVTRLQDQLRAESRARQRFYETMTDEFKMEFIDGEIIMHSPAAAKHLRITKYVTILLEDYVDERSLGEVLSEKCLVVFPRNDYEPDVVFFKPEKVATFKPNTRRFPQPDLAVEVLSDSTEHRDRGVKFEDFQANGVGEYWIVDSDEEILEQYLLGSKGFEVIKHRSGNVRSRVIEGLKFDVRAVFDPRINRKVRYAMRLT